MIKLKPLLNYVLVRIISADKLLKTSIILPESTTPEVDPIVEVIAIGPGINSSDEEKLARIDFKVGDFVVLGCPTRQLQQIKFLSPEKVDYALMQAHQAAAVIDDGEFTKQLKG